MTSVNSKNYGSVHISDNRDLNTDEREKTGDNKYVSLSEEDPYQELEPVQESWRTRHKQCIGEKNMRRIDLKKQLENYTILRNKSCTCIWRNFHCQ